MKIRKQRKTIIGWIESCAIQYDIFCYVSFLFGKDFTILFHVKEIADDYLKTNK
jgi:hypothetical protein